MKKIFNSLFVIIASMVAFSACVKEENSPASETKTVQFFAESIETKTAFGTPDGTTYPTLWTANDKKVYVALNDMDEKESDLEISQDFKTARFETQFADNGGTSYKFFALSPASAKNSMSSSVLSANIWNAQTPLANSVDERAQVLYAVSDAYSAFPASVNMVFKHFTAYGKLSFANVNLNGAKMTSVTIESSVNIAGRWNYNVNSGEYTENSGSSAITLNTTATENIWFACAPVDMDGQSLTFTINTDKGPLSKTVTLSGKKFEAGKIAKMVVDMSDAKFAEQVVFELVTNVNDLTVGSEIIIAASASNVAISTTQNGNNRAEAAITKSADKSNIVDPASGVQVITVKEGTTTGTLAFYVGNGYLYAASSSSNYMRTETTLSANSSWNVTIASTGVATIKAAGSNTRNWLRYNSSSKLFSCYSSGQADVVIYKKRQQSGSDTPEPDTTPEISLAKTELELSAAASEGTIAVTSVNIASIEVRALTSEGSQDESDWLVAEYDEANSSVNYSAAANESAENRTAYIEVYALDAEGKELVVGVEVTQAGKVLDAVIEDGYYWIVSSGKVATPISGTYGYLSVDDVWTSNSGVSSLDKYAFLFTSVEGGYTIQDKNGKYYYMTGTYNSFNLSTSRMTDGSDLWSIEINDNREYVVTNKLKSKYLQYSSSYGSYGAYASESGSLPTLVAVANPVIELSLDSSLSFESSAETKTITLPAGATVVPSVDNDAFTVSASANIVTVSTKNASEANSATLTLVVTYNGFNTTRILALSQKAPGLTGGGRADLETLTANSSYSTYTTTLGWKGTNCAVLKGGTTDSNPQFKCIGGANDRAFCMNGKTTSVGKIVSPELDGGCGTLSFDYAYVFSESKGVKFKVDIMQSGSVVKTFTITNTSLTKFSVVRHDEEINVSGKFSVIFTNLSPSNSTSNKDRTAIWNIEWTGCN